MSRFSPGRLPPLAPVLALAAVALAIWSLAPGRAEAHAILVRSDPPVNARLADTPTAVTTFFSETLDTRISSMQVLGGTGERVDSGETTFGPDPAQMSIAVGKLGPGFYTVVWETLSSIDGHLLKGSFPFTVLNPDGSEPTGPHFAAGETAGYSGGEPTWENVATKWLGIVAAVMVVGGLAFLLLVVRPASMALGEALRGRCREAGRRHLAWLAWPALGALAVAGAAEVLLQARQLGGLGFIDDTLRTSWGERWIQRQLVWGAMVAALFLAGWLWRRGRERLSDGALGVALAGGLAYLLLVAMVSHGASIPGSFWAIAADFVHLVASSVWVGMLAQLALFLLWSRSHVAQEERPAVTAAHLQRFSVLAATSGVLLLASGAVNGLSQIPVPEAMLDTAYGRVLTIKLSLMMALLAVAGVNALYLRPRVVGAEGVEHRLNSRLAAMIRVEIGLALVVLLAAAVLAQYPTARQERAAEANVETSTQAVVAFEQIQQAGDVTVDISIAPNEVGTNSFRVFLFPPSGGDIGQVQRVRLRFKPPDPALGPSEIIANEVALNQYKAVGAFFTRPGDWEVQVDLRRAALDDVSTLFRVNVIGVGGSESRDRFALPLVVGSWTAVAAVGALLAALLMTIWATQWPRLPMPAPRLLRVSSAAITVLGVAALVAALWPGVLGGETSSGNPIPSSADSIAIGRSLFADNCAKCHGDSGHGDGPLAAGLGVPPADFRAHVPYHSDKFFFQVISNGLGTFMPAFGGQLTKDQRWHLINFLKAEFGVNAEHTGH